MAFAFAAVRQQIVIREHSDSAAPNELCHEAVDFHLFPRRQHQPTLLHAGAGRGAKLGAVVTVADDANLADEFGGFRVGQAEVADQAAHDRYIRFRFRVRAGDGLLGRGEGVVPYLDTPPERGSGQLIFTVPMASFGIVSLFPTVQAQDTAQPACFTPNAA